MLKYFCISGFHSFSKSKYISKLNKYNNKNCNFVIDINYSLLLFYVI